MHKLSYGQPDRRVCWLVTPTSFDEWLPEDHTLIYVVREPYAMNHPGNVVLWTPDRQEAADLSRKYYSWRHVHVLTTEWYDAEGHRVHKPAKIRELKGLPPLPKRDEYGYL